MRICCISDLHGYLPEIPECDLLLLAGDLVPLNAHGKAEGRIWLDGTFRVWLDGLSERLTVVGVAGNHDFVFEDGEPRFSRPLRWTYLQDSATTFEGSSIWGTPWQPTFYNWAFNLDEPELASRWDLIPEATNILLLHGPPFSYGDPTPSGPVGSRSLLRRIQAVKPTLAVAGHVHSGYGVYSIGPTTFVNASLLNEDYRPANRPVVLDVTEAGTTVVECGPL
ncbi:metallophosphoesterase family protein [Paludisphaera rhizosphaerae]|uniref:metallophosphoesterase family protein n=1 Tax=Paludisphaera rhizosphaerae TaxID=2711216 RepID=UPI0013EAAC21|nr:metallophosphoesterase [Paludisphaera rhizosphaerae]